MVLINHGTKYRLLNSSYLSVNATKSIGKENIYNLFTFLISSSVYSTTLYRTE